MKYKKERIENPLALRHYAIVIAWILGKVLAIDESGFV